MSLQVSLGGGKGGNMGVGWGWGSGRGKRGGFGLRCLFQYLNRRSYSLCDSHSITRVTTCVPSPATKIHEPPVF
jgi:hypothetical protein